MNFDDQIQRAIALSLQESSGKAKPSHFLETIVISSDDEDDEQIHQGSKAEPLKPPEVVAPKSSFLSERAQLEKERRERQQRYLQATGKGKAPKNDDDEEIQIVEPSTSQNTKTFSSAPIPLTDQLFFEGEIRPTATRFAEPRQDRKATFRLTEILGPKPDISFAILSTYAHDIPWIYQFFEREVPMIFVAHGESEGMRNILPNWIKTVPKLIGPYGCMHMKFMIIFYKTGRLRVVISSANLVPFDYRDIENVIWLQDIPPRGTPIANDPKANDFPAIMQRVLHGVNVRRPLELMLQEHPNLPLRKIEDLRSRWDFGKVKVHLVPSLAGKHDGWPEVTLTGHTRLMMAIRNLGLRTKKGKATRKLEGSSIGTYTTQWVNEFFYSARGESPQDYLDDSKAKRSKLPYPPLKIIFPSKKTVQESALGVQGGGTIFCRKAQWNGKNFPRDKFYDSKSRAGKVLMHTKMIIGLLSDKAIDVDDSETEDSDIEEIDAPIGWGYLGSHNFTPSAWGTLSGSAFRPVLNIKNYEIGIVFPIKNEEALEKVTFWERPPKRYDEGGPWIQEEFN
ncbi:tyrosyl-DNA phosphodiesterase-domain-containing protein [Desarmillaria tabescens]|uniref:Tyrosyl-DNA phosphodiesterase-domain-containing protein n=1 Tax=Armillaria tabescens TaxID=1929756 RepID=A0AA39N2H2_ARMTA|nr:tyrosyl-DNA phosphodiesterase-domain-containing protein [Desarmillaria tabescens]KAK0455791.1 tyrosyl-DNA phosphodiesterase-domain-containing protein [Desarmillaria tabescens]